jgi:hypothetical protein
MQPDTIVTHAYALGIVTLIATATMAPFSVAEIPIPDTQAVLNLLRAKDAQFDNAHLKYAVRSTVTQKPFPAWQYPGLASELGIKQDEPRHIEVRCNEELIVRGPNATFIRTLVSRPEEGTSDLRLVPFQKWSNTEELAREITEDRHSPQQDRIMDIRSAAAPVNVAQEQRMAVEFALGFGFGKRIRTIDKIERRDDHIILEGTIQIWWEDESTFTLELDSDYLVRRAVIDADVHGNLTRFEVSTSGVARNDGYLFAREGHFTRSSMGRIKDGKKTGSPQVVKDFMLEFGDIALDLSDEEYRSLTKMEITPGTYVIDHIAGLSYRAGDDLSELRRRIDDAALEVGENLSEQNMGMYKGQEARIETRKEEPRTTHDAGRSDTRTVGGRSDGHDHAMVRYTVAAGILGAVLVIAIVWRRASSRPGCSGSSSAG